MKTIKVVLSAEANQIYKNLEEKAGVSKTDRILLDAITKKIEIIKMNPYYGNNVPKRLIPHKYKKVYSIRNLYRIKLPLFWRMLYTLANEDEIKKSAQSSN